MLKLPPPWAEFLAAVDKSLSHAVEVHCVGGFILSLLHEIPRSTADLDYIDIYPDSQELEHLAGRESELTKKYKVFFHRVGGISDFPEDYQTRMSETPLGLQKLSLKALDPYDLALSKLTRNNPKDMEDVKFLAKKLGLSFATLYGRWEKEMKPWVPHAERHETTLNVVWKTYFSG